MTLCILGHHILNQQQKNKYKNKFPNILYFWNPLGTLLEPSWNPLGTFLEPSWIPVDPLGSPWIPLDPLGSPWIPGVQIDIIVPSKRILTRCVLKIR